MSGLVSRRNFTIPAGGTVIVSHGISLEGNDYHKINVTPLVPIADWQSVTINGDPTSAGVSLSNGAGVPVTLNAKFEYPHSIQDSVIPHSYVGATSGGTVRKTLSIAPGKRVHYYPRTGEPSDDGTGAGKLVTIADDSKFPVLTFIDGTVGRRFVEYGKGLPGTWEPLDYRHRRSLRLPCLSAHKFLDAFESDPTLFDFWLERGVNWHETAIDNIILTGSLNHPDWPLNPIHGKIDDPALSTVVLDFQRAAALGIPMNMGVLSDVNMPDTSYWFYAPWWQNEANKIRYWWSLVKDYADEWIHLQMEIGNKQTTLQATKSVLDSFGVTIEQALAIWRPWLDAIAETGCRAIVRPFKCEPFPGASFDPEIAMTAALKAGASGSIYCSEFQTQMNSTVRSDEYVTRFVIGGGGDGAHEPHRLFSWGLVTPPNTRHVPLHSGGEFRMSADVWRDSPFDFNDTHPVVELVDQVDGWRSVALDGPFVIPRDLGKREWYYMQWRADTGAQRSSANDIQFLWTIAVRADGGINIVASKRMSGKDHYVRPLTLSPWRRDSAGNIDVNVAPAVQTYARGFICKMPASTDARCWVTPTSVLTDPVTAVIATSFTLAASFILPTLPGAGVTYGVMGNGNFNLGSGAWAVVLNGDAGGQLELRTVTSVGGVVDTFVIDAAPAVGSIYRIVIGYDRAQQKWLTCSTGSAAQYRSPASGKIWDPVARALVFGAAHNPASLNTVWGLPEGMLADKTDIQGYRRAVTVDEATCIVGFRWPYNYYTAFGF